MRSPAILGESSICPASPRCVCSPTVSHLVSISVIRLVIRYFETDHIHITVITVPCYNSVSLLVIVNLLLCLAYKVNFIKGIDRKKHTDTGFSSIHGFRHPLGSWNVFPVDRGDHCIFFWLQKAFRSSL